MSYIKDKINYLKQIFCVITKRIIEDAYFKNCVGHIYINTCELVVFTSDVVLEDAARIIRKYFKEHGILESFDIETKYLYLGKCKINNHISIKLKKELNDKKGIQTILLLYQLLGYK